MKNAHYLINKYSTKYRIEGDFDYFCKLFNNKLKWSYLEKITVNQTRGGLSDTTYFNKFKNTKNIKKILKNEININYLFFFKFYKYEGKLFSLRKGLLIQY